MLTAAQAKRINDKGFWFMDHKAGTCRHIDNTSQPPFIKRCRNIRQHKVGNVCRCAEHYREYIAQQKEN